MYMYPYTGNNHSPLKWPMSPKRQAKRKRGKRREREEEIGIEKEKKKLQWKRASEETNLIYYQQKSTADVRVWLTLCSQLVKCTERYDALDLLVFLSLHLQTFTCRLLFIFPRTSPQLLYHLPHKQTNLLYTGTCVADHQWNTITLYFIAWRNGNNSWSWLSFLVMSCERLWTLDKTIFSRLFSPYTH